MPTRDCGQCERLHCGNRLGDRDIANLVARLLCEVADNTASAASGTVYELFQDDGNAATPFIRFYNPAAPTLFTDLNLNGTVYVPTGPVSPYCCPATAAGAGTIYETYQDDGAAGVPFIRVYDPTAPATFVDYNLDGTVYLPVGPVSPYCCDNGPAGIVYEYLQDDGAAAFPFTRVYDPVTPTTFVDYNLAGVVYIPTGPVSPRCCVTAAQGAVAVEDVTLKESAFDGLELYLSEANTDLQNVYGDTVPGGVATVGFVGTVSAAIWGQAARAFTFSPDYTELQAICGTVAGTQTIETVDVATRVNSASTVITGMLAGTTTLDLIAYNPKDGLYWVWGNGAPKRLYTIDIATGVLTDQGICDIPQQGGFGMDFLSDGRLIMGWDTDAAIGSILVDVLPTSVDNGVTTVWKQGRTLIKVGDTGAAFRGPLSVTARNTILSLGAVGGLAEYDLAGNELRRITAGTYSFGFSIAYLNPFGNRKIYAGSPVRRVTVTDSAGVITATRYFLEDGTEITSVVSDEDIGPILPDEGEHERNEASILQNTTASGSITTAYSTIVSQAPGFGCRILLIENELDTPVMLAFTSPEAVNQIRVAAGAEKSIDFAANGVIATGSLTVKSLGGNPLTGELHTTIVRRHVRNRAVN